MGFGNESGPCLLERMCTSVCEGCACGKETICNFAGNVAEGSRNMLDKIYGTQKEGDAPAPSLASKAREISSTVASDVKGVALNLTGKSKVDSAVGDSKSSPSQCNCVELREKYGGAVVTGVKVAAAVLVVAGVARGAIYCYRSRCKKTEK